MDVSSISTATITVGGGGAGSTSNDTKGGDGGDSSWADGTNTLLGLVEARQKQLVITGLGGAATGGDLNVTGGTGGTT